MTQEELRTKLNGYDLKGATLKQLIEDRDFARDMYLSSTRRYSTVCNAVYDVRSTTCECRKDCPTREVEAAVTELLSAMLIDQEEYFHHMETLENEINERLSKMDSNN